MLQRVKVESLAYGWHASLYFNQDAQKRCLGKALMLGGGVIENRKLRNYLGLGITYFHDGKDWANAGVRA